jgi:hypothetical protein
MSHSESHVLVTCSIAVARYCNKPANNMLVFLSRRELHPILLVTGQCRAVAAVGDDPALVDKPK